MSASALIAASVLAGTAAAVGIVRGFSMSPSNPSDPAAPPTPSGWRSTRYPLAALEVSTTAANRGLRNKAADQSGATGNLAHIVDVFLEPVSDRIGSPILVTSGFRSKAVNQAIGGSTTSDHCYGRAVDFCVPGLVDPQSADASRKLAKIVYPVVRNLGIRFDQFIVYETYFDGRFRDPHIHIGIRTDRARGQVLLHRRGGSYEAYTP